MAAFRKCVLAFAVLALFATAASAQLTTFTCVATAAVPPLLRAEGITELTGDIVLTCSGSIPSNTTSQVLANIQVFYNTNVTSRLDGGATAAGLSEALLLIDEPAPLGTTTVPLQGIVNGSSTAAGGAAATKNTYQGVVSGNSVLFTGIPILPAGTTVPPLGNRIFRITNVRANASAIGTTAGVNPQGSQLQGFVSISASTSIPVNNPQQIVGFVQTGMNFNVRSATDVTSTVSTSGALAFAQCSGVGTGAARAILEFQEGFPSAFKTQGTTGQSTVGAVYNTESGLTPGISMTALGTGTTPVVGLSDFGTRLKASFTNIPSGVTIFVSVRNVTGAGTNAAPAANLSAVLVASETQVNGTAGVPSGVSATNAFNFNTNTNLIGVVPVSLDASRSGTAVWEVTGADPFTTQSYFFPIYFSATANTANNLPTPGAPGQVAGDFAPTSSVTTASSTAPIPRFVSKRYGAKDVILFNICQTALLFPYVVSDGVFDTGLAIANTSKDPFGTAAQSGTCTLNLFSNQATVPPNPAVGSALVAGEVRTWLASRDFPSFGPGYVIAVCNFQFAHGFAFVSDLGARNLAMGYLALVLPSSTGRSAAAAVAGAAEGLPE